MLDLKKIVCTVPDFLWDEAGIYKIINKKSLNFYIGSAVNLRNRYLTHGIALKNNYHGNKILQAKYNNLGAHHLIFALVEIVPDKSKLIEREQYYIDTLKPKYNIAKIAGSTMGFRPSEETRKKLSESHKGIKQSKEWVALRVRPMKESHKKMLVERQRIDRKNNPEKYSVIQKKATNIALRKNTKPIYCLNNNTIYSNALQAAKSLNIQPSSINRVCNGVYSHTRGFKFCFYDVINY